VEYCLLTARTLDEKMLLQCCIVVLTDLLRPKLEVGVGFLLNSTFTKTLLGANDAAASFSAVLTDITHSRVGPWDLCLSLY
jgi:hypothetical protein